MSEENRLQEKRSFLKGAINAVAAFFVLAITAAGVITLLPAQKARRKEEFVPVADEDDAPRRGVREFVYTIERDGGQRDGRVLLVRSPEGLLALSPACTHLGCAVVWHRKKNEFLCPCHGGRYDISGNNIEGPPPAPLRRFPVAVRNGKIHIKVPV
jgi:Rieske Fe-S protein